MSTLTAPATKAPRVTTTTLQALLAQRGGIVVWDLRSGGSVAYACEDLTGAAAEDPDLLPVLDYAEVATRAQQEALAGIATATTAVLANAVARGLL